MNLFNKITELDVMNNNQNFLCILILGRIEIYINFKDLIIKKKNLFYIYL